MTIWGFVGPSGTGKSHRALETASKNGIDCIIDDGLLIQDGRVLAGVSAKREPSKLASVRRAIFTEDEHAESVRAAIRSGKVASALILGTSSKMVDGIAERLGLPRIARYLYISEVASEEEIASAMDMRRQQGKHVIPAPTLAIKKQFSGYVLDPLLDPFKRLARKGRRAGKGGSGQAPPRVSSGGQDRTVVRPTFSYLGSYTIARQAIEQIIGITVQRIPGIARMMDAKIDNDDYGVSLEVSLAVRYGCKIHIALQEAATLLREEMDRQTALNVLGVAIIARVVIR